MNNKIKGVPIYVYNGTQSFNRKRGTKIVKYEYDDSDGVTYCYLKLKSFITELLCIIIIAISICAYVQYSKTNIVLNIPDEMEYYNGILYTNIDYVESNRNVIINYKILNKYGNINLDTDLPYIDIGYYDKDYIQIEIEILSSIFSNKVTKDVRIIYIQDEE